MTRIIFWLCTGLRSDLSYSRYLGSTVNPKPSAQVFWTDTVGLAAFAVLGARIAACLPDQHVHAGTVKVKG